LQDLMLEHGDDEGRRVQQRMRRVAEVLQAGPSADQFRASPKSLRRSIIDCHLTAFETHNGRSTFAAGTALLPHTCRSQCPSGSAQLGGLPPFAKLR
jgi:hypothetical protein